MMVNGNDVGQRGLTPGEFTRETLPSRPGLKDVAGQLWHGFVRQHAAFKIACFYLIFEYNRPHQIWPVLDFLPWAQVLLISGLLLTALDPEARKPRPGVIVLLAAFALAMILSTAFAYSTQTAMLSWHIWLSWIFVVVFLTREVSTRERVLLFVFVYYLVNLKMAQHGFRTWAGRGFGMAGWGVTGSPGWFANSGEFGMEMAMLVPLLGAHLLVIRKRMNRPVLLAGAFFLAMVIGSVIASNSRGALLGLAVAALWLLASSRRRLKALVVLAIATMAVIAVIPEETLRRFDTAGTDLTSQSRLTYWKYGIEAVHENPVFGMGLQNWVPYLTDRHPEAFEVTGRIEVIHNTYLQVATELGLFGLAIFVATLAYVFRLNAVTAAKATARGDPWLSTTATGLNGGLVVYLVTSFFMAVLLYPYLWLLLAMSAACASALKNDHLSLPASGDRPDLLGALRT